MVAPLQPRRVAAALEHLLRRNVVRRPSSRGSGRSRSVRRLAAPAPAYASRPDLHLGPRRPQPRRLQPLDAARPQIHRHLVAVARHQDLPADYSYSSVRPRCILGPMVSVTIVTWNSAKHLEESFAALNLQDYRDLEVIIVDNASEDGTRDILRKVQSKTKWRIIYNEKNVGFAAGQNQAIRASRGEWVLCLNPDVMLSPNFVTQLMSTAGESCFDAGVFCGKLLRWDPAPPQVEQPFRVASSVNNEAG